MPLAYQSRYNQHQMSQPAPMEGCGFCKRNRESPDMILSHKLKDSSGRVTCPMLRRYVCAGCGATGDNAHTRSYCPNVISARQQREIQHRRQALRSNEAELRVDLVDREQQAATGPQASTSSEPSQTRTGSIQQPEPNSQQARPHKDIELGANRAFYNMSRVTNSRYNSAGWLRDRHRGRNHYQTP